MMELRSEGESEMSRQGKGTAAFPTEGTTGFEVGKKRDENKGLKPSGRLEHGVGEIMCGDEAREPAGVCGVLGGAVLVRSSHPVF